MRDARTLEPDAWARIVEIYGPVLYSRIRNKGLPEEDAADVVQETFLSAAKKLPELSKSRSHSFRGWIWVIARNKMLDHIKRQRAKCSASGGTDAQIQMLQVADTLEQEDPPSDELSGDVKLAHRITEFIQDEFTWKTYQAFHQIVVDGKSGAEVAESLGMTVGAVYKAKSRVLARVRQLLDDPFGVDQE